MTPDEALKLQAAYRRKRLAWRKRYPDRVHTIDERAIYLAPEHLRPVLAEDRT